jgi:heme-degrading monooxygenase HmoA
VIWRSGDPVIGKTEEEATSICTASIGADQYLSVSLWRGLQAMQEWREKE